ncbi:MAG: hypothetical protein ACRD3M_08935, partial [Thermoanaerobaculia bacterium]
VRGTRRFRNPAARSSLAELLWAVPVVAAAWWASLAPDQFHVASVPMALLRSAAYVLTAI